jgi:Na+/H+ antiporter NhaD/arsenite permease-like protein
MVYSLSLIFAVSYLAIALEHPLKINKSSAALIGAGLLWAIYALFSGVSQEVMHGQLAHTIEEVAQIVFFLMAAMTIVELIDAHEGFSIITQKIRTTKLSNLVMVVCIMTFFLSAVLDNLTTAIVMCSLLKKLLAKREDRLIMGALVVISSNAGGAWSPIGDVTTTMLWVGGQITATNVILNVFLPSLVCAIVPLLLVVSSVRGQPVHGPVNDIEIHTRKRPSQFEQNFIFFLGIGTLIFIPVFKAVTHLPPFIGAMFGLGVLWLAADILHKKKLSEEKTHFTLVHALSRIDMPSVIFFVGILLAVATLQHAGILTSIANWLSEVIGDLSVIVILIGLASSLVDNVPMVAASMSMFSMTDHPTDSFLWEFLAYCAGTGGSILIIGSAAGLAVMGLEKIDFVWYLKKVSLLAFVGYISGAMTYIVQYNLMH